MIEVKNISKSFDKEEVLQGLCFFLEEHQTLGILGQSGSGKSTLLKIMAGLEKEDDGNFLFNGNEMLQIPPQKRGVVYLSQEPLLFPHLNVFRNLAYGLEIRKVKKDVIKNRVGEMAEALGIKFLLNRMPYQLSGGERQRVSFGRALIINPKVLLLDEPFGSLDSHTRKEMQSFFKQVKDHFRITAVFVTHDVKEAILMGDKIAMMENKKLRIFETIKELKDHPGSSIREEMEFWKNLDSDEREK